MQSTAQIVIRRQRWPEKFDEAYEESVTRWLRADPGRAEAVYRAETFPLSCERIRRARAHVGQLDLLFVPVGTQPYAPILAVLGNPAACVALLESDLSAPFGSLVESALADTCSSTFLHVRIAETDTVMIAEQMKAVYDSRGLPSGSRVGADITGGRKPMTAAISGVGSLFGWRIFYVQSEQVRERMGYGHHETIVEIANVLNAFGSRRRETAIAMLMEGECAAAARVLRRIISASAASARDQRTLAFAEAAALLREGDVAGFAVAAPRAAASAGMPLPRAAASLLRDAARRGAPSQPVRGALLWLAARERLAAGHDQAAHEMLVAACKLMRLGTGTMLDGEVGDILERIAQAKPITSRHAGLVAIDSTFGRGLSEVAARLL